MNKEINYIYQTVLRYDGDIKQKKDIITVHRCYPTAIIISKFIIDIDNKSINGVLPRTLDIIEIDS